MNMTWVWIKIHLFLHGDRIISTQFLCFLHWIVFVPLLKMLCTNVLDLFLNSLFPFINGFIQLFSYTTLSWLLHLYNNKIKPKEHYSDHTPWPSRFYTWDAKRFNIWKSWKQVLVIPHHYYFSRSLGYFRYFTFLYKF